MIFCRRKNASDLVNFDLSDFIYGGAGGYERFLFSENTW